MMSLRHALIRMPGNLGEVRTPAFHPSRLVPPTCLREYLYRVRLGWVRESWSEALRVGSVMHEVLARYYSGTPLDVAADTVQKEAAASLVQRQVEWAKANPDNPTLYVERDVKAVGVGTVLARVLVETFPFDTNFSPIAVEQKLSMPIGPILWPGHTVYADLRLEGTVDLVLHDTTKNQFWIVDHKSTGDNPTDRARGLTFDTQVHLYRDLWNGAHPTQKVCGAIHSIIRKPTIRLKKGQSFEEYLTECYEWFDKEALKDPHRPPLIRSFVGFTRPPLAEDDELKELLADAATLATRLPAELSDFPRIGSAYGGCCSRGRVCPYMSLCEAPVTAWADILTAGGFTKAPTETSPAEAGEE